jgi:hypothetical protein
VLAGNPVNFYFCRLITNADDAAQVQGNVHAHTTHRLNNIVLTPKYYEDEAVGGFVFWIHLIDRNR